ncbi:MAG: replication-relaxation family protein [Chloroflexota bacterium]
MEHDRHNGIIISIQDDYTTAFKGGNRVNTNGRRKQRAPLAGSIRQAARDHLHGPGFTPRDEAVLETLLGVGLLSRDQIQRLFFWSSNYPDTAAGRLKKLYERHLLNYTPDLIPRMRAADLEPCHVYSLGPVGEEVLAIRRGMTRSGLGFSDRYDLQRGNPLLMHDLQVSEVYVRAKLATRCYSGEMTWHNEQAAALRHPAGQEIVRPDGAIRIVINGTYHTFFVEMDRGSTRWPDKVGFYEEAHRRCEWSAQFRTHTFPQVLCIIPPGIVGKASDAIQHEAEHVRFLVKTWPAFLRTDFFQEWQDTLDGREVSLAPIVPFSPGTQATVGTQGR